MSVANRTLLLLTVVLWPGRVAFPEGVDWFSGGTYDPRVPTIEQVLGFGPPERFTSFYETEKLLHAWAEAVPDRARLIEFGEDYEGKTLYMLVVSSPENIVGLDEIRQALGKLADPRKLSGDGELDRIIETTPASFLISTIDTSEASSVEAMQLIAYQLLAGMDDLTERIRREVVTYVVPVENPSPRERYVAWYNTERSVLPKADRNASEHQPPWGIGTDTNHYHLDPNRDGVSMLMRETRAKAALMREWRPEVALDVHEMGVDSTFFFPPYPEPYNKNLPIETLKEWWELYASDLRKEFDQRGWRYFSGDAFGSPFLGMHTLYTQYLGAIGILFEQAAGEGGLVIERSNGSLLTLRDRIQHHFTGAMSMLKVTADHRSRRHRDYHEFFESSLDGVPGFPQKRYVFPPGDDPNRTSDFIDKLLAHGIEVQRASGDFSSSRAHDYFGSGPSTRQFPAGSYIVSLSQPLSRLANAVLEREPFHSVPFFYDVSVWALPYNYGIEGYWTEDETSVETEVLTAPPEVPGGLRGNPAQFAYAWPYRGNREAAAAFRMAADGFRLHLGNRSFRQNGVGFETPVVVFLQEND
ncbi:MAG TPA: M14 family zinc carboxypeptidase, partial [Vicinamibacteria bacterium]